MKEGLKLSNLSEKEIQNKKIEVEKAASFRDAAVLDGWTIKPTYEREPQEYASTLEKDGFLMMVLSRPPIEYSHGSYTWDGSVHIFGPDGLAIETPEEYSWEKIKNGLTVCSKCKKIGKTKRAGFASRVCDSCLPEAKKELEYPGWTN
jgi:hypothetical protein